MTKKLNTFNRRGNTFITKGKDLYVLCNDSKFRVIDQYAFKEKNEIIVDLNSTPYKEEKNDEQQLFVPMGEENSSTRNLP